ncbi:efflux RND transporter periplasmic adaptor subunit [Nitrospirales bacterium NOB]|nr:efflux RND transporter periplasmic adaptor subunit [Nitrospira sp. NTP2]MCK6493887.1 efflux RND transporter periplasmic adaptor subunit [Nitrospira sp.]MDL1890745.1 efflux RND transporter periplasmic adaptor subunit [Nitrospirales bacterium NOB]MEB2337619.1 efflux RND transporter periplasmic adaptor subunit [Nitrospirales bacterium]MCK6499485.1 efflux RND transporter periplasmic adaptor subunit [Nitrospira sp.]
MNHALLRHLGPIVFGCALAACTQPDSSPTAPTGADAHPTPTAEIPTLLVQAAADHPNLTLSARVTYAEDGFSRISSPLEGPVLDVRVKLGQTVKAGDILMVIDAADIAKAYAAYVEEISELGLAERNYELTKDLYDAQAMSRKDLEHAENDLNRERAEFKQAKERLLSLRVPAEELSKPLDQQQITSRFALRSPLTGTVVERNVTPGQMVGPDTASPLFTVADLRRLQVIADVYERDLSGIRVGSIADMTVEAYPGLTFPAAIAVIGDVVDPATRTIKIRASVSNDSGRLKPEMFARLMLAGRGGGPTFMIPRQAVVERSGKQWVIVRHDQDRYEERAVVIEGVVGSQVTVLEGLSAGERIVLTPSQIKRLTATGASTEGA